MNSIKRSRIFIIIFACIGLTALVIVSAGSARVDIGESILSGDLEISGPVQKCEDDFILFGSSFDAACDGTIDSGGNNSNAGLEALRNNDPAFLPFQNVVSNSLDFNALTNSVARADNGASPQGQFRTNCHYSHLAYDDPIFFPDEPGKAHLHMFFGNTALSASTYGDKTAAQGGGSCDGGALNRTGYWIPALFDAGGNVRISDRVIIYYKTRSPGLAQRMPQGLEIVAGEHVGIGTAKWSCGENGFHSGSYKTIPNCNGATLHAGITFPQCWDGRNLRSTDHISHMKIINESNQSCPSSHPVLLPQIEVLVYWRNTGNTNGWYLSSDRANGAASPNGSTLHSDWLGGWNDQTMDTWTNNCIRKARNCSGGQLGINRTLKPIPSGNQYQGPKVLKLP